MKKLVVYIAVFILSLFAVTSLTGSSYFPMHDDTQVGRVIGMARSLSDGQFPVRWVNDLGYGYGYPLFNFYAPLPYYIASVLVHLGIDPMYATKIMMALGMILAPLFAFFILEPLMGLMGASVSALLFMYAPYHAVQLYVRGAVGELYATAFLPLILYGIIAPFLDKKKHRTIAIGTIGIALTILSHTILGFVSVILYSMWIVIYACISRIQKKNFIPILFQYLSQIGLGIFLTASFWLPALLEMRYTNVAGQISKTADFKDHFICAYQLLYSPWGFGGSTAGCMDGMSFKLGLMNIAIFIYALFILWCHRFRRTPRYVVLVAGIVTTLVSLYFSLPTSLWVWQHIPGFAYIQYPWRFLSIASFGIALVGGYAFTESSSFAKRILVVFVLLLVLISNRDEFTPQQRIERSLESYSSTEELHFRVSKISDEYLPKEVIRPQNIEDIPSNIFHADHPITTEIQSDTSLYLRARIMSLENQDVVIYKTWFPDWQYSVNGSQVRPNIVNGFPKLHVLKGESVVELRLSDTPIERTGNILSLIAIVCSLVVYVIYEKNNT